MTCSFFFLNAMCINKKKLPSPSPLTRLYCTYSIAQWAHVRCYLTACLHPDRSAVEIQYAAVYTEGILPSIQCTCSIYCQFSIPYTAAFRVSCIYTLPVY